jgi:hypothetical protein
MRFQDGLKVARKNPFGEALKQRMLNAAQLQFTVRSVRTAQIMEII